MPASLIESLQFAHLQRWWMRRGPPPWLDDPRWWVRAFRVSLLLGALGTLTGWLSVGGMFGSAALQRHFQFLAPTLMDGVFGLMTGPGFWFGAGVLIPLSRWLGRHWILSLLSVPASMFACYCGVSTMLLIDPIMESPPDWVPFEGAAPLFAGFVGAAIVSVWMGNPLRASAWRAGALASVLAAIGCGSLPWMPSADPPGLRQFGEILRFAGPYVTFQSLTAIGLGLRLWWHQPPSQSEAVRRRVTQTRLENA